MILSLLSLTAINAAEYGPVAEKESLWNIASRNRPSYDITTQQMMLAIRMANPSAFQTDNINSLKAGAVLYLPSLDEVKRINQSVALHTAKNQNIKWKRKGQLNQRSVKKIAKTNLISLSVIVILQ